MLNALRQSNPQEAVHYPPVFYYCTITHYSSLAWRAPLSPPKKSRVWMVSCLQRVQIKEEVKPTCSSPCSCSPSSAQFKDQAPCSPKDPTILEKQSRIPIWLQLYSSLILYIQKKKKLCWRPKDQVLYLWDVNNVFTFRKLADLSLKSKWKNQIQH